jgi:hypothetical protein
LFDKGAHRSKSSTVFKSVFANVVKELTLLKAGIDIKPTTFARWIHRALSRYALMQKYLENQSGVTGELTLGPVASLVDEAAQQVVRCSLRLLALLPLRLSKSVEDFCVLYCVGCRLSPL